MADPAKSECWPCHTAKVQAWAGTGHSTLFKLGIDGVASSHYGESCIECHTVGYNTETEAVNDGFDDIQLALGWTFPSTPQPGEWDSLCINFPELAKRGGIQCENCHGPVSEHKTNFDPAKID
ncbi:MAG: hypothetical protein GWN62_18905, partial [Aliifodinibius sp.]|nr:hypothetical protein [Fodinibius sp.]